MAAAVTGSIPEDADLDILVTNNAKDSDPVWEIATGEIKWGMTHYFDNRTAENGFAFNFKITVRRGESGEGGYISHIGGAYQ